MSTAGVIVAVPADAREYVHPSPSGAVAYRIGPSSQYGAHSPACGPQHRPQRVVVLVVFLSIIVSSPGQKGHRSRPPMAAKAARAGGVLDFGRLDRGSVACEVAQG